MHLNNISMQRFRLSHPTLELEYLEDLSFINKRISAKLVPRQG